MTRESIQYGAEYFASQNREIRPDNLNMWFRIFKEKGYLQGGERILEIGSGNRSTLNAISGVFPDSAGVDINETAIQTASELYPHLNFQTADSASLPFDDGSFEAVFSIHTLEHVRDLTGTMREIDRVLKKGSPTMHVFPYRLETLRALPDAIRMVGPRPIKAWRTAKKIHPIQLNSLSRYCEGTNLRLIANETTFETPFFLPSAVQVYVKV